MNVDWRNRFGRNWITTVRDQRPTVNCWAFATTALYEAMIRIEHCLWTRRSEGDLARGTGKQPWDIGNIGEGMIFVERYGLTDPDCFPWSVHAALYTAKPHGASISATPLAPSADRAGRTMRIAPCPPSGPARDQLCPAFTDPAQKKQWIDLVGPMAVIVIPPSDFGSLGSGIYVPTITALGGAHALLVVGFNDDERYWIVKNSWGPTWGVGGFGRVSYDAGLLEAPAFIGLRGTNPDPWAKRRLRNGVLVQGGNGGSRNNFELFVKVGMNLEHWYRENSIAGTPWNRVGLVRSADPYRATFNDDAVDCPAAVQSTFNRSFELLYRTKTSAPGDGRVRHVYYDQASGWWSDATTFGPSDPVGIPAFIQSNRGAPGDFEAIVVTQRGQAEHWTKHNSWPWTHLPGEWYLRERFGWAIMHSGPSLVQSRIGVTGSPENGSGELHYVCTITNGQMQHWRRLGPDVGSWSMLGTFGQNVSSAPCMIEGTYGAGDEMGVGNFELCVAVGNQIEHWWRYNTSPGPWNRSAVFGSNVRRVIGLIQSTYGTNLEIIAERTDGRYQHYWRDGSGWHAGVNIT